MDVIRSNSETQLFEKLQACWQEGTSHRCLYLPFSKREALPGEWIDGFVRIVQKAFDDNSAAIFVCHDRDVFIVARQVTHKTVDEFLAHLTPKLMPAPFPRELAPLFEVSVDWMRLKHLCAQKVEAYKIHEQKIRAQKIAAEKEKYRAQILGMTIEKEFLAAFPAKRAQRETPKILIAEDDPFTQKLIHATLGKNFDVLAASSGRSAITTYAAQAPDVLFLDIGLPDISGHDVLSKIFEIDPLAYVVMLSGNGDRENVLKAVQNGAKGFIGKPFTKEKLLQYIQKSPFIHQRQNKENHHANSGR